MPLARDGERLGRLVGDLLGLARIEAHPSRPSVDLVRFARTLVDDAWTRAARATITLSAADDTTIRGDPDALERVFRNLIDNALAAIQPGGRIDVQLRRNSHGLGLAIARCIAQQHHGDLTCDATPSGARFTLRVPAER